jgi:hypothetical protein
MFRKYKTLTMITLASSVLLLSACDSWNNVDSPQDDYFRSIKAIEKFGLKINLQGVDNILSTKVAIGLVSKHVSGLLADNPVAKIKTKLLGSNKFSLNVQFGEYGRVDYTCDVMDKKPQYAVVTCTQTGL